MQIPIDWMIGGYYTDTMKQTAWERVPNLVQHMGYKSTFNGNGDERKGMKSQSFQLDEQNTTLAGAVHQTAENGYVGCFRDAPGRDRDLSGLFSWQGSAGRSPASCAEYCKQYRFFAIQVRGMRATRCTCSISARRLPFLPSLPLPSPFPHLLSPSPALFYRVYMGA